MLYFSKDTLSKKTALIKPVAKLPNYIYASRAHLPLVLGPHSKLGQPTAPPYSLRSRPLPSNQLQSSSSLIQAPVCHGHAVVRFLDLRSLHNFRSPNRELLRTESTYFSSFSRFTHCPPVFLQVSPLMLLF